MTGVLLDNMDLSKSDLRDRVGDLPGKVRSYKMISVYPGEQGRLDQYGSGPNFQGGRLTLCTCQCAVRAEKRTPGEWRSDDWWVAGFTSPRLCGRTWLFYLAKIERAFESQAALWAALPRAVRTAKASRRHRLGDLYEPDASSGCPDPFEVAHYHPPMVRHSHRRTEADEGWHKDIEFFHAGFGRRPVLLSAEPSLTFLWQTPRLYVDQHPRNDTWAGTGALLQRLRSTG